MILYIFLFLCLIILLFQIYIKIKYPFWSRQPVFHYHNLYYWLFPCGKLDYEFKINKYFESTIQFIEYKDMTDKKKALICRFLRENYAPYTFEYYNPPNNGIINYLEGHNRACYISIYDILDTKGTITSIPFEVFMDKEMINMYYIDFLCVKKKYRNKGYASKIIYSHVFNTHNTKETTVSIFKREGNLSSYVPLTVYNSYIFDTKHWVKNASFQDNKYQLINMKNANMSILNDIFEEIFDTNIFDCVYKSNINNLSILIENNHLLIFVLMIDNIPCATYIYKNNYVSYENSICIDLIGSYSNTSDELFTMGYLNTLAKLSNSIRYDYLLIENISHNHILLKKVLERYSFKYKVDMGYYFYNYVSTPFLSSKVFCIT